MKKDKLLQSVKHAILQEAIQGKLTEDWRMLRQAQQPPIEPASELLKRIKAEKERLIKEKKIKKENPLLPITQEEIPFELPEGWVWCRLGEIIVNSDNLNIHKEFSENTLINYVDIDAIDNKSYKIKQSKILPVKQLSSRARRVLKKGYILYSLVRPYLNNLAIIGDEKENYIGSTGFAVFDCLSTENKYIFWLLLTKYIENIYLNLMDGFNSPSITHAQFKNTIIPLPPLAEQKAIVKKVEKLIQQAEAISQGAHFKDFEIIDTKAYQLLKNYYFIKNILNEITTQKENITHLKQSILQEAIQGKLTADWRMLRQAQQPPIEPASELLKRIKAEKEKLIAEKKIRKEKPLPPITEEEIPFELPDGWAWCRLIDVGRPIIGLTYKPTDITDIGTPVLRANNIVNGLIVESGLVKVSCSIPETKIANKGDVLICVRSGSKRLIGKAALIEKEGFSFGAFMSLIKSPVNEYLYHFIQSNTFREQIDDEKSTGINQLTQGILKSIKIPLPPLAEQKAIVKKVENLMQKVSAMEEEINKSEQNAELLMQAVLKEAFEGNKEKVEV